MDGLMYIVMGKSATGKDTLYAKILKTHPELAPVIPYTTRPIREGERDGEEYHFVDIDTMQRMKSEKRIIESRCYHTVKGDWYYFTAADEQLEGRKDHIMITTLEVADVTRIERAIGREKKEDKPCIAEVCRRYLADDEDFSEDKLKNDGIIRRVTNEDLDEAMAQIGSLLLTKGSKI